MTFEVQQTRWDRIIRRVSGSIGPGSRVGETLSELFPVVDVERVPGELLFLGGTILGFGGVTQPLVAAQIPKVQLFNPAESNALVTITSVLIRASATIRVFFTNESVARPTAATSERFRDSRGGIVTQPVAEVRRESSVTAVPAIGIANVIANEQLILDDPNGIVVLAPNSGFVVGADRIGIELTVTFFWRERPAEQSELNL